MPVSVSVSVSCLPRSSSLSTHQPTPPAPPPWLPPPRSPRCESFSPNCRRHRNFTVPHSRRPDSLGQLSHQCGTVDRGRRESVSVSGLFPQSTPTVAGTRDQKREHEAVRSRGHRRCNKDPVALPRRLQNKPPSLRTDGLHVNNHHATRARGVTCSQDEPPTESRESKSIVPP